MDTDIGSDSDDVGAMMVLHRLRQAGECNLLAVTSSTSRKDSVAIIDVINRYYGADVPTGNVKGKKCSEGGTHGMYSRAVAFAYGSRYIKEEPENAVTVLRRALAAAKDKVRLVTIGSFANVAGLLKSGADGISPLSGAELVERKVSEMYSMAGNFKGVTNFYGYEFVAEWQRAAVFGGQHIRCGKLSAAYRLFAVRTGGKDPYGRKTARGGGQSHENGLLRAQRGAAGKLGSRNRVYGGEGRRGIS